MYQKCFTSVELIKTMNFVMLLITTCNHRNLNLLHVAEVNFLMTCGDYNAQKIYEWIYINECIQLVTVLLLIFTLKLHYYIFANNKL